MKDLLFASNNLGKYLELKDDFEKCGINLIYDGHLKLEEESELLKENALSKARQAALQKNMPALGDDSGVFIEALDYFPGVHSRRWAGKETDDEFRNEKILEMMKNEKNRTAFLISRFALVDAAGTYIADTVVKNKFEITCDEKGDHGFGYDKILTPSDEMLERYILGTSSFSRDGIDYKFRKEFAEMISEQKMAIAEMDQKEKNALCDRGRIAEELKDYLK